jgi:RHS repeat-associated protein
MARHDYLPFGEEIPGGYAGRNSEFGATDSVSQRFTGQTRDSETGLDFFNTRYFGAALGRFTSPDPGNAGAVLSNPQSWNGYSYVWNNPLNAVDPSGACSIGDDGVAHDDAPGDCGGGSTTVDGGSPDEVSTDPCFYLNCWGGGGGGGPLYSITYTELVPVPKPGQPPTSGRTDKVRVSCCSGRSSRRECE